MSGLVYQNYNNKCQGWVNPSNLLFGPQITSLSSYQSPAGSSTLVSINGINFYSYSSISFGTFNPTVYFINSNLLQFYIPSTLNYGTFPVQVFNGSVGSNIVNYTIDNAPGYWMINDGVNTNTISNTNSNGVQVSWLSRGAPQPISNNNLNPYNVPNNVNWIICDTSLNDVYVTLPTGTQFTGREIMFKRVGGTYSVINTGIPSILPLTDNTVSSLSTYIMNSTPMTPSFDWAWVTLVYNGSNWITMQAS